MSLIRCLSNPEGLYIWCEEKRVALSFRPPLGRDDALGYIPTHVFRTALQRYLKGDSDIKFKGLHLWEDDFTFKWRLTYESDNQLPIQLEMWEVTLAYVASNVSQLEPIKTKRKK